MFLRKLIIQQFVDRLLFFVDVVQRRVDDEVVRVCRLKLAVSFEQDFVVVSNDHQHGDYYLNTCKSVCWKMDHRIEREEN